MDARATDESVPVNLELETNGTPGAARPIKHPRAYVLYKHSIMVYWWPVWLVGFILAGLTYLEDTYVAWVPPGTEARRDWQVEEGPGTVQTREGLLVPSDDKHFRHLPPEKPEVAGAPLPAPQQPHVRLATKKALGYIFMVVLVWVLFHTAFLHRGYVSYVLLALGSLLFLIVCVIDLYGERIQFHLWPLVKFWCYDIFDIYISWTGYMAISTALFALWWWAYFFYDRRTYMTFTPNQVKVVEVIGEGEMEFTASSVTYERRRDDFFRHKLLGLGILYPIRTFLTKALRKQRSPTFLGFVDRELDRFGLLSFLKFFFWTTGAGDLVFRVGGPTARTIEWPNVFDVHTRLKKIEYALATTPTTEVEEEEEEEAKRESAHLKP